MGVLKSIYETKCALLDKIVNFCTRIVKIFLYRNFDGSMVPALKGLTLFIFEQFV